MYVSSNKPIIPQVATVAQENRADRRVIAKGIQLARLIKIGTLAILPWALKNGVSGYQAPTPSIRSSSGNARFIPNLIQGVQVAEDDSPVVLLKRVINKEGEASVRAKLTAGTAASTVLLNILDEPMFSIDSLIIHGINLDKGFQREQINLRILEVAIVDLLSTQYNLSYFDVLNGEGQNLLKSAKDPQLQQAIERYVINTELTAGQFGAYLQELNDKLLSLASLGPKSIYTSTLLQLLITIGNKIAVNTIDNLLRNPTEIYGNLGSLVLSTLIAAGGYAHAVGETENNKEVLQDLRGFFATIQHHLQRLDDSLSQTVLTDLDQAFVNEVIEDLRKLEMVDIFSDVSKADSKQSHFQQYVSKNVDQLSRTQNTKQLSLFALAVAKRALQFNLSNINEVNKSLSGLENSLPAKSLHLMDAVVITSIIFVVLKGIKNRLRV